MNWTWFSSRKQQLIHVSITLGRKHGCHWLPLATIAFFDLLRAIHAATIDYTAERHTRNLQQLAVSLRLAESLEPRRIGAAALLQGSRLVVDDHGSCPSESRPVSSVPSLVSCVNRPIKMCSAPSPVVQEQLQHYHSSSRPPCWHASRTLSPVHTLRSVSISQVPQGYRRGGCGVPAHHGKRQESGSVPASRTVANSFEVGVQLATGEKQLLRLESLRG